VEYIVRVSLIIPGLILGGAILDVHQPTVAGGIMNRVQRMVGVSRTRTRSDIVVSQIYAIDRRRLLELASKIHRRIMNEVENGIRLVLGME